MNERKDLTRWNRAGLSRFRYINGNAATFLETLRLALASEDRFPVWLKNTLAPQNESESKWQERILEQYNDERRDYAWEINRTLARACHILTEYMDAYANEGYLGTATQWDNVRRLVEMIDYHPAPPASASTTLVLKAKDDQSGTVAAGFQVKYSPSDGSEPVVFETLEDLEIDAKLNELRPAEYNRNQDKMSDCTIIQLESKDCTIIKIEGEVDDLKAGEPIILEDLEDEENPTFKAYVIQGTRKFENFTEVTIAPAIDQNDLLKGYTKVHAKPKENLSPIGPVVESKTGEGQLHLTEEPNCFEDGQVVWIGDGIKSYFRYADVNEENPKCLDLYGDALGVLCFISGWVSRPTEISVQEVVNNINTTFRYKAAGDLSWLDTKNVAFISDTGVLLTYNVTYVNYDPVCKENPTGGYTILEFTEELTGDAPKTLLIPPIAAGEWKVDTYLQKTNGELINPIITSQTKKTSAGDFAVVTQGSQIAWAKLESVDVDVDNEESKLTAINNWAKRGSCPDFYISDTVVYAHFTEELRLLDWQENTEVLEGNQICMPEIPAGLQKGRKIVVEKTGGTENAIETTVGKIEDKTLVLGDPLPGGCKVGNLIIYGNAVLAGHGEKAEERVLGSGDATLSSQSFVLEVVGVSFIADPIQPSGVKADIEITVDGRIWTQVANFNYSEPTDFHYTVRMTEDEYIKVTFGDGKHGRRLPSGTNNVRINYRKGAGLGGILPAGSLGKPVKPHPLVEAVSQPLRTTGGNDMEGAESLRENAPATLLTLERAVSLSDFTYLATSQSSVWQARAFSRPIELGRNERIEVIVVPAGGGELDSLEQSLANFLQAHAIPGVDITIVNYSPALFSLEVLLSINTEEYLPEKVVEEVKTSLQKEFSLQNRKLGQNVYLSEVYNVVESVEGVIHSQVVIEDVVIKGESTNQRVPADDTEVITLDQCSIE